MIMDIACPTELIRVEQAHFGEGGGQAYLTFLNESENVISALSGRIALLSPEGRIIERRRIAFDGLRAQPGASFTCHLALEGYPPFEDAEVSVEQVEFLGEAPWVPKESRVMDVTPPPLENGPERVALVAVAGHDAVCFPQRRDSLWICACGRFNRWRWRACRRCGRERDTALETLTPDAVLAAYQAHARAVRGEDQKRLIQRAEETRLRKQKTLEDMKRQKRTRLLKRRAAAACAMLLVLGLLVWGGIKLFAPKQSESKTGAVLGQSKTPPPIDYLEPLL